MTKPARDFKNQNLPRFCICGTKLSIIGTRKEVFEEIERGLLELDHPRVLVAINPEKIVAAKTNPALREGLERRSLNFVDGVGIVWALRFLAGVSIERIPGVDLFGELLEFFNARGGSVFLFGAAEEVNQRVAHEMSLRYSKVRIVGRQCGYKFNTEDLLQRITAASPDLLVVALGSPRQELWIFENLLRIRAKFVLGVGGSFDVFSGSVKRAPSLFRRFGLEWLYRVLRQPQRLFRLHRLIFFIFCILRQKTLGSKATPSSL